MNYYLLAFQKMFVFSGRANMREYWYFTLANAVVYFILTFVSQNTANIFILITLIPVLAVTTRRLHDTNRSGWFVFLNLIPVIGSAILFFLCLGRGTDDSNQYGKVSNV